MIDAVILINTVSVRISVSSPVSISFSSWSASVFILYPRLSLWFWPHDLDHLDPHDHDYRVDFPHPLSHICLALSRSFARDVFPQTFRNWAIQSRPHHSHCLVRRRCLRGCLRNPQYAPWIGRCFKGRIFRLVPMCWRSIFHGFWRFVVDTLLGTNISSPKGTFEDDVPFPKVGYVSSRRVHDHVVCRCTSCTCILLAFCMLFAVNSSSNTHLNLSFSWQFMYTRIHMNDDVVIRYFHLAWSKNA